MMTGWDDYADELLSAYLDGETSSEECVRVAQQLARSAEYTSRLEALRALQEALRHLPRYRLAAAVEARIQREIERLAASSARSASPQEIEAELLSAYLDGEVSPEERARIAQRLASDPACASHLEALQALQEALRDLPRYRLATAVEERILREIERLAVESPRPAPGQEIEAELLSAYLDGEVSDQEREWVERVLADSAPYRSQLEALRTLDAELRGLPVFQLDDGFAGRVLRRIEIESETAEPMEVSPAPQVQPAKAADAPARRSAWRGFVWAAAVVAAAVVLMVNLVPSRVEPERPGRPLNSPLTLINHKLWDRLVLVYDVSVEPEGVEQGVFFQLLKRHGVQVLDTVPVPEREQRSLLSCQFLDDVVLVSAETAGNMDEIRLYLVYCSARQADAMWDELRKRPAGFGSFFLNLTTRREGGGVLPRLCDAAGIRRQVGEAVPLEGRFAVSRSNRKLAAFGTIGYIAPDLLAPAIAPGESILKETQKAAANRPPGVPDAPNLTDDFPCELLFVVRNLRSPIAGPQSTAPQPQK